MLGMASFPTGNDMTQCVFRLQKASSRQVVSSFQNLSPLKHSLTHPLAYVPAHNTAPPSLSQYYAPFQPADASANKFLVPILARRTY